MFRKITVSCFISFIWLFSAYVTVCLADELEEILRAKENICSLIEAGRFTEARSETEKMAVEFVGQEKLPEMLYWVAERYERVDKFEEAKQIYQQTIQNYPNDAYANKSQIGLARAEVKQLITSQKFEQAEEALDRLAANFAGHPDLADAIFWIAERFERQDKFGDAGQNYQHIMDDFPNSPWAQKSGFCIARANVKSLIVSGQYEQAKKSFDKFVVDFEGNPALPEAVFWLTKQYERQVWLDEAKQNYQRIIQQYPYSSWAKKAKLGISTADVTALIESKDYNNASAAIDKMASDFAGHPDLPGALHGIAEKYRAQNKAAEAERISQQIMTNYPGSPYAKRESLSVTKERIISLITSQKFDLAKTAIDGLITSFADNSQLPEALFWITERFQRQGRFDDAKQGFERIIQNYPDSPWADKSRFWLSKVAVMSLAASKNYDEAGVALEKFTADYGDNPDFLEALYWIAERFERDGGFEQARRNYEKIIQQFPGSPFAERAKLGIPRAEAIYLVLSQDYDLARELIDKMAVDFKGHPDLPGTLYWLAERYKGANRTEDVERIYQKILQDFPDHHYANRIRTVLSPEIAAAVEIQDNNLVVTNNSVTADSNQVTSAPSEQQKAAVELYRQAREYEQQPENVDLAKQTYEQIISQYPGTIKADNAVLDIRRLEIWEKIKAGEISGTEVLLDKFIADFKQHPYAGDCLNLAAEKCRRQALVFKENNQTNQAQDNLALAEGIWQRMIDNLPGNHDKEYISISACRQGQGDFYGAIEYYQKVVDNYGKNYAYGYRSLLGIALCYESLRDSNQVSKEEINPLIEETYKELLAKYPDHAGNSEILLKLGWLTFTQGRLQDAISYFEKGLRQYPVGSKPSDALYAVGRCYQNIGQNEKAVKVYEELLSVLPADDPKLRNVRQKLSQLTGL